MCVFDIELTTFIENENTITVKFHDLKPKPIH